MSKSSRRFLIPEYGNGVSLNSDVLKHVWDNLDGEGPASQSIRDAVLNDALAATAFQRNELGADNALARQRELRQTAFQDTVQDAQAAGVNPYFALSGGATGVSSGPQASAPGASTSSGSPRVTLDSILGIIQTAQMFRKTNAEIKNVNAATKVEEAQAKNIDANTAKAQAEYEGIVIDNKYRDEFNALRNEGQRAVNGLTYDKRREITANIRNIDMNTLATQAGISLTEAKALHERIDAIVAAELLPYQKAYQQAATAREYATAENQKASARNQEAQAGLAFVQAAYQQGLIDNGYLESVARQASAGADAAESQATYQAFVTAVKTGDPEGKVYDGKVAQCIGRTAAACGALVSATGIGEVLNIGVSRSQSESKSTIIKP